MDDELLDWADVAAIGQLARHFGVPVREQLKALDVWGLNNIFAMGIRYGANHQLELDAAVCNALSRGLDPCREPAAAYDCERAIRRGMTPDEALRILQSGESFDA